jgi:hypothetical protein
VLPGALGILELPPGTFRFVADDWLADFGRHLDLQDVLQWLPDDGPA